MRTPSSPPARRCRSTPGTRSARSIPWRARSRSAAARSMPGSCSWPGPATVSRSGRRAPRVSCCSAGRPWTACATSGGTSCRRARSGSARPAPTGKRAASASFPATIGNSFRSPSGTARCSIPERGLPGAAGVRCARYVLPLLAPALLSACASGPGERYPPPSARVAATVHVAASGWHADLIVPRAAIPPGRVPEAEDFPRARFLRIGWGDRDFYTSTEFSVWYGLKALFWPSASVLHVVGFTRAPAEEYPHDEIVALPLTASGARALFRYLDAAFARRGAARAPRLMPSPYGGGWFYPAQRPFHLL